MHDLRCLVSAWWRNGSWLAVLTCCTPSARMVRSSSLSCEFSCSSSSMELLISRSRSPANTERAATRVRCGQDDVWVEVWLGREGLRFDSS